MKSTVFSVLFSLVALFVLSGCDSNGSSALITPKVRATIDTQNLEPLKEGYSYVAWVRVGTVYYGTEAFNVTASGQFTTASGQFRDKSFVFEVDISDADLVLISVEGKTGKGDVPSNSVVMAADVTSATSALTTSHPKAIGVGLASHSGTITIMTPSDIETDNEAHGVWYLVPGTPPTAGLSLPSLKGGWIYEGWVEVGGHHISTGPFISMTENDTNNQYSNPDVLQFPGEDFLFNPPSGVVFPLNLDGATVYVTVEPSPDDNLEPYGIKVLSGELPSPVTGGSVHALSSSAAVAPTATILIF